MPLINLESRDFPPLSECIFPGDRVVIAPDESIAQEESILADLAVQLLGFGLIADDIAIILTEAEEKIKSQLIRDSIRALAKQSDAADTVRIVSHKPGVRKELALLGANEKGEPIGLCRELIDADFVIPIGVIPNRPKRGYYGIHSTLFPRFCDGETQLRFAQVESDKVGPRLKKQLATEIEDAAFQLGVIFTIQRTASGWVCGSPESFKSK